MLLRMPGVGGGTTKKGRLSLLVGAVYRMAQDGTGMLHSDGLNGAGDVDGCGVRVEYPILLYKLGYRIALRRVSNATENEADVRTKLPSGSTGYRVGCGDVTRNPPGWDWGTGRKWNVLVWVPFGYSTRQAGKPLWPYMPILRLSP